MKKLLALFLAMMMVVSLAACGSSTAAPASSAAAAESSAAASEATATKFPTKQITVICPLGAGGASDAISRLYAAALQKESGVSVVVENKPGAGAGVSGGRAQIGIANVRERLKALCGGTLSVHSEPGKGTEVVLSIPKRGGGGNPKT